MAHIAKSTRLQVAGLIAHDIRSNENHSNEMIDPTRSELNYNLIAGDPLDNYNKRLSEVYCLNRKDVNTLVSVIVTLPKDVDPKDERKFFESCNGYLSEYFKEENVVSAIVHNDETTPHLHFKAIPVYFNEKRNREQVSYDKVCPRDFYKNLHGELSTYVNNQLGYEVSIQTGLTSQNKAIEQLKQQTLIQDTKNVETRLESLKTRLSDIEIEYDTKKEYLRSLRPLEQNPPYVKTIGNMVTIPKKNYEHLHSLATDHTALKNARYMIDHGLKESEHIRQENEKLKQENKRLKEDLSEHKFYSYIGSQVEKVYQIIKPILLDHKEQIIQFAENKLNPIGPELCDAVKVIAYSSATDYEFDEVFDMTIEAWNNGFETVENKFNFEHQNGVYKLYDHDYDMEM